MRIILLSSGEYGSRIINNIATHGFAEHIVGMYEFPDDLPEFLDDVDEYIPKNLPKADLLISTGLFGDINLVIPEIVKKTGVKSVIIPIHDPKQIPAGLQSEIQGMLKDTTSIFPKPFCSLVASGDPYIDEFSAKFGKPKMEIEGDTLIKNVNVITDAPCGCTNYIAEKIVGMPVEDAELESGNKFHNYPCLASMSTDQVIGDTYMHLAGYKIKEAVKRALGFAVKTAKVDKETCSGGDDCDYLCMEVCPNVKAGDQTIFIDDNEKAEIDPASCGVCEICIKECPNGSIEVIEENLPINKDS